MRFARFGKAQVTPALIAWYVRKYHLPTSVGFFLFPLVTSSSVILAPYGALFYS